jgi:DNA-binding XRE family transcriptional regulator
MGLLSLSLSSKYISMNIGQLVQEKRNQSGITQVELAQLVGVSRRTIQLIEQKNTGRLEILSRCLDALKVEEVILR